MDDLLSPADHSHHEMFRTNNVSIMFRIDIKHEPFFIDRFFFIRLLSSNY